MSAPAALQSWADPARRRTGPVTGACAWMDGWRLEEKQAASRVVGQPWWASIRRQAYGGGRREGGPIGCALVPARPCSSLLVPTHPYPSLGHQLHAVSE